MKKKKSTIKLDPNKVHPNPLTGKLDSLNGMKKYFRKRFGFQK